jgi:tRNA threonylcarbamoyladenosine biosynthesis protein TsaB
LLAEQGWKARALDAVIVSRGPGSYTGLRVGLMSAKTLAYATGCDLVAIDTFAAVAAQTPGGVVDVIADAQQDKIYVQRFVQGQSEELGIVAFSSWLEALSEGVMVGGPGLEIFASRIPPDRLIPSEDWLPRPESLLRLGLDRFLRGERDDPFTVEPLYLRPSSAEEKWQKLGKD